MFHNVNSLENNNSEVYCPTLLHFNQITLNSKQIHITKTNNIFLLQKYLKYIEIRKQQIYKNNIITVILLKISKKLLLNLKFSKIILKYKYYFVNKRNCLYSLTRKANA